jgi:hypothetical protein
VAEWIARVYRYRSRYRVVVEGLFSFEADRIDGIEEQTAREIADHLRRFFPTRAPPREDPAAERVMEFAIEVRLADREPSH